MIGVVNRIARFAVVPNAVEPAKGTVNTDCSPLLATNVAPVGG